MEKEVARIKSKRSITWKIKGDDRLSIHFIDPVSEKLDKKLKHAEIFYPDIQDFFSQFIWYSCPLYNICLTTTIAQHWAKYFLCLDCDFLRNWRDDLFPGNFYDQLVAEVGRFRYINSAAEKGEIKIFQVCVEYAVEKNSGQPHKIKYGDQEYYFKKPYNINEFGSDNLSKIIAKYCRPTVHGSKKRPHIQKNSSPPSLMPAQMIHRQSCQSLQGRYIIEINGDRIMIPEMDEAAAKSRYNSWRKNITNSAINLFRLENRELVEIPA